MLNVTEAAAELAPKNPEAFVKNWLSEINDALKREKTYRKLAVESVQLYEGKKSDSTPFNILYSNTETLVPAIYNSLPVPIVERKFRDPDPVGKSVSEVSTRTLKFLLSNDTKDHDGFDDLMQAAVLDGVVTNRGLNRFRYSAAEDGSNELVIGESVRWDKFLHGYARSWKKVPWIAFEWDFSKDELKKNFPKAKLIDLRGVSSDGGEDEQTGETKEELTGVKTYKVYEVWDKITGKVFFISSLSPEGPLRYVDDPLNLSGFFPVPKPLNFMRKITTLVPTPLYEQYRQQAAELNVITLRLKAIIKAIRFRGAYNAAVEGIEKMLNAEDNELVPVENVQSMPEGMGIDKLLWVVPVNELAATAQSLYQQRESVKQVIYEITGISDILRGSSMASETATAQNIKNQWGTLRLKRMQREVMRYCRDSIAIMLEIAAAKFELQTLQQMTGLPYMTAAQKQQFAEMQQQLAAQQQAFQQAAQQAQATGQQPPQPPPAPQIPPELQQAASLPAWEDIIQVLHNRLIFNYKVEIETNSTIDAEAAQDKQDIAELMNALSQFINGVGPLVQEGVFPVDIAKSMLLVVCRRYHFGSQMEDAINSMQPPQPQQDPNHQAKVAAEGAKLQVSQQQAQLEMMKAKNAMDLENLKFQHEQQRMGMEHDLKMADIAVQTAKTKNALAGIQAKSQASAIEHQQRMEMMKETQSQIQDNEN